MSDGVLRGPPEALALLRASGVRTVAELLARAEVVRDLPSRTALRLTVDGATLFVKRLRARGESAEEVGRRRAERAGVRVAPLACIGEDAREGSVCATFDVAPARPLDDLLREGALPPAAVRGALRGVARSLAVLHAAGWRHREPYLCHAFLDPSRPASLPIWIDFERTSRLRLALGPGAVKDLAAVVRSLPDAAAGGSTIARFLAAYLVARDLPRRRLRSLRARVACKAARIRAHAPRTPVGDAGRAAATTASSRRPRKPGA